MEEEELKKEILTKFRDQLDELGAKDVEFVFEHEMPKETEMAQKGCWVYRLGKLKKYTVLLICGIWGCLQVFVLLAELPDTWKRFQVNYPDTFETVEQITDKFKSNDIIEEPRSPDTAQRIGVGGKYRFIVYDPDWSENKELYFEDMNRLKKGDYFFDYDRKAVFFPSSASPEYIVINSTASQDTFT